FEHIVAVGGDGTFNETIQSLVGNPKVTFGAIAAGTGNDFITILGFAERFSDRDWDIFFEKNTIQMDAGKCNDRFFINGMGLGFDAQVAAENYHSENSRAVKKGSKSKYWKHILKTLVFYREKDMKINLSGEIKSQKSFLNTIANGRRLAGGFYLTPDAIANDNQLTICLIDQLSFLGRITTLLKVIKQKHTTEQKVNYFTTDKISFEFENEVPAHLDGELYFNSRFDVSIVPAGLKIIFNPFGNHFFKI
ncbi:MAG TPA: hypothetical protein ENN22_04385, partial [bacterium]|nr:hypothetical protein [bacterium]